MAVTTTDLNSVYDEFMKKGLDKLTQLQKDTEMEDEQLITAASNIIIGAMQNSVSALETLKRVELVDLQKETETKRALDLASSIAVRDAESAQDLLNKASEKAHIDEKTALTTKQVETETKRALDLASSIAVRDAQSNQDMLIKQQQELAEMIKNGVAEVTYTYIDIDDNLTKTTTDYSIASAAGNTITETKYALSETGTSIYDAQKDKVKADIDLVTEQKTQLGYSVIYNNRLKTLQNYSNTLGNIGLGGFVIPTEMWTTYFNMVDDCYKNWGEVPADKTFSTNVDWTTFTAPTKA